MHFLKTLRIRLLLLVLLSVIPMVGLTLFTAFEERELEKTAIMDEALRLARLASSSGERLIESTHQLLMALSHIPAVRERHVEECNTFLADVIAHYPSYTNLAVSDPSGNLSCSAVASPTPVNASDLPWFKRTIESRGFSLGDYQIGRVTGRAVLICAYPVHDDSGGLLSVVAAGLSLEWFNQMAAETQLPEGATLSVVDRNGTVLARYPDPQDWVGKPLSDTAALDSILTGQEGTLEARGMDGVQRLYAFTPLGGAWETSAYVRIGIPAEPAYAQVSRTLWRNLAVLGLITLLVLLATYITSNLLILRPVERVRKAAEKLAEGDLSTRTGVPDHQYGEIGCLAGSFDRMAEALERYREENRRIELELRQARKVEAIGTLAGGFAHDFNNILTTIVGYTDMALCDVPLQWSSLRGNLERVLEAGFRAQNLVSRVLAFSRMRTHRVRTPVLLGSLIEEALHSMEPTLPPSIAIRRDLEDDEAVVLADPAQLIEMLVGLCTNAVDAMREKGGVLKVTLDKVTLDNGHGTFCSELLPGPYFKVTVTDTGHGMEQTTLERIFDPYFTTRGMDQGAGLGLAVALGIAKQHGGTIKASSVPERGSSFEVFLPIDPGKPL